MPGTVDHPTKRALSRAWRWVIIAIVAALLIVAGFAAKAIVTATEAEHEINHGLIVGCLKNGNPLRATVRGILRDEIKQSGSPALLHRLFPQIPPDRLDRLIAKNNAERAKRIRQLAPVKCATFYRHGPAVRVHLPARAKQHHEAKHHGHASAAPATTGASTSPPAGSATAPSSATTEAAGSTSAPSSAPPTTTSAGSPGGERGPPGPPGTPGPPGPPAPPPPPPQTCVGPLCVSGGPHVCLDRLCL